MARPEKNNLDYFSHDNDMRNGKREKALRSQFGLEGYAIYIMFQESLCQADLLVIEWNDLEIELTAGDFGIPTSRLTEITDYLIKIGLLNKYKNHIYCDEIDKKSETVFGKRTKDLIDLRIRKGIFDAETPITEEETTQTEAETPQSKVKQIKEKQTLLSPETQETKLMEDLEPRNDIEYTAKLFYDLIKANMQKLGINSTDVTKQKVKAWTDAIRLMMERDKRSPEVMKAVYVYLRDEVRSSSGFLWQEQIRSPQKLREKFEKLLIAGKRMNGLSNLNQNKSSYERASEILNRGNSGNS